MTEKVRSPQEIQLLQKLIIHNYSLRTKYQRACKELSDEPVPICPTMPCKPVAPAPIVKPAPIAARIAEIKKAKKCVLVDEEPELANIPGNTQKDEPQYEQTSIVEAINNEPVAARCATSAVAHIAAQAPMERPVIKQSKQSKNKLVNILKNWYADKKQFRRAVKLRKEDRKTELLKWDIECARIKLEYRQACSEWRKTRRLQLCKARVKALEEQGKYMESMLDKSDLGR